MWRLFASSGLAAQFRKQLRGHMGPYASRSARNEIKGIGVKIMTRKLEGKIALSTGVYCDIAPAIAKRLAADGASVAITYAKDASAASAVVQAIELDGGRAISIKEDAADDGAI